MKRSMRCGAAAILCSVAALGAAAQSPYRVLDHWKIGGTGGWDYLLADAPAHRLYVTHNVRVEVLDTTSGKVVGAVTGLKGTHAIALDPDGKTGYISDGGANQVVIFDRKTLQTLGTVATGANPDGIAYEPTTRTVWAFNGRSNSVSVVDPAKRAVVATIALPGKPEFPQADGEGAVFVNIEDKNSIVKLNAATMKAEGTWALPGCESPSGMAMDHDHARLFSVCDASKMAVTDARTGKQLALANIGDGPDAAGYDAKDQLAFSSNGDATLTVIDAAHGYKPLQTVVTKKGARTMAYDAAADRMYVVTSDLGAPAPGAKRPTPVPDTFEVLVIGRK